MTTSNLPKTGVQAIVENFSGFIKDIGSVNKAITDSGNVSAKAADKAKALPAGLDDAAKAFDGIRGKIGDFIKQNIPFGQQLGGIVDQLIAIPLPALAAVAAITALAGAFFELGKRGADLVPLAQSFDNLTASVDISSQALLVDLRKAANGTVSDFDLIKRANLALVGSTGEFGKEFGKKLPQVLAAARAAAKATGQDVDFLFQSLVAGIKRASPRLIDNTGIVLKLGEANDAMAKSLGKSTNQLTEQEKQIAILNATVEAGNALQASLGNQQESNAEKIARANATITNTLDGLAIAVQPAYGTLLDATQKVLDIFQQLAEAVGPIFGGIASIIANVFGTIIDIVTAIVQPIVNIISSIAPYFALAFQTVANILSGVGKVISGIVGKIVQFLKDVAKNFFGLDLDNLGPQLFNGAAAAFGSFANGIIAVANKLIFPAVIAIAKFIADFLIGFSPPKKGPLSVIDKGGENLMLAWLDGISGVSLDPVKQVAQEVSDALGDIGKQGIYQVNARLAQLDKALLPFQNRLDIVKANFEALSEPAKLALDAIDRESAKLQEAVLGGDQGAAEKLKLLDQQRDAIQKQVDLQQGLVDRSQIQLTLMQAQQAPERSLLNIRKAYLDALAKSQAKTTSGRMGEKAQKEPKSSGTATPTEPSGGGIVPPTGGDMPSVLDLIGGQGAVDAAGKGIQDAFMGAIDQSGLDQLAQNSLDLGSQLDRIKSVDLGAKISDKFKGLTDAFNPSVAGSIANVVYQFFNGTQDNPNSIAGILNNVTKVISPIIDTLKADVQTLLASVFDPNVEGSPASIVVTLTGDSSVDGSIAHFFAQLPQHVSDAASGLFDKIKKDIFDPVKDFLTTSNPGSLGDIINQAVGFFTGLPTRIVDALRGIGASVYTALALPVIKAINGLIGLVESGIKDLINKIADFVGGIANALGDATPQFLRDAIGKLHDAASGVSFGRISEELPAFLQTPAAPAGAKGGLFGEGLFKVGEKGPEYLFSGQKFGVLPNQLVKVLDNLSSIIAQPQPMPVMGGGGNVTTNNSSFSFNGVQSDNDARRRYNALRAGMR